MNERKYNILYNCFLIIHLIDNNLLMFINDYKVELIKLLKDINAEDPIFILELNNVELKNFCKKLIERNI